MFTFLLNIEDVHTAFCCFFYPSLILLCIWTQPNDIKPVSQDTNDINNLNNDSF